MFQAMLWPQESWNISSNAAGMNIAHAHQTSQNQVKLVHRLKFDCIGIESGGFDQLPPTGFVLDTSTSEWKPFENSTVSSKSCILQRVKILKRYISNSINRSVLFANFFNHFLTRVGTSFGVSHLQEKFVATRLASTMMLVLDLRCLLHLPSPVLSSIAWSIIHQFPSSRSCKLWSQW